MMTKIVVAAAVGMLSLSALAGGHPVEVHILKDGATLYVFGDGKMGMEDKYGRPVRMAEGVAMTTTAGQQIAMKGDEVAQVDALLFQRRGAD